MSAYVGYGAFHGGDPRRFTPDPECSTEAEREAHRRACAVWNAGAQMWPIPPDHEIVRSADGQVVMHIARSRFGLGTYVVEVDDDCERCKGSGVVDTGEPSDADADATVHVECPECRGTGVDHG